MEIKKGVGVSAGFAIGPAFVLGAEEFSIFRKVIGPKEGRAETARFKAATEAAAAELTAHVAKLSRGVAKVAARILESQCILLRDESLHGEIIDEITKQHHSAEYATTRTLKKKTKQLADAGMTELARELNVLENLLLRNLTGAKREDLSHLKEKVIVVAHDLSPAQTVGLDRSKVLGMLTEAGGRTSHTAIVASSLGIPAVVGIEEISSDVTTGDIVVLDGATGTVIVNPDDATLKRYQSMERNFQIAGQKLSKELRDCEAITPDGTKVEVLANIELPEDVTAALAAGAEGVGLYRTEFIFLANRCAPEEKHHLEAYRKAATLLGGRRLVVRTLDLGADKMPPEMMAREDNPFLGMRGVRLLLARPELLRTQLRALLRASGAASISIMVPMISSLEEIEKVREVVNQVRDELVKQGESVAAKIPLGVMIEVPSAALTADTLAPHVDFFSIGTNDLIAYTLAVDRTNEHVAKYYQPGHPAVLRLLKTVIDAGTRHGKGVAVCGEMASDLSYTLLLLGLGLRTFSCVVPAIPEVKRIIRAVPLKTAKAVAAKAMAMTDPRKIVEYLRAETRKVLPAPG